MSGGFVADTDPRFVTLHPDLRQTLREAEQLIETDLRKALCEAFAQIDPVFLDLVKPSSYEKLVSSMPAIFIRGQYQLWKMLHDNLELGEYLIRQRQECSGPASTKTH